MRTHLFFWDSKVPQNLFGFAEFEFAEISISSHHWLVAFAGCQSTPTLSLDDNPIVKRAIPL